jgi:hypothetical protein
VLPVLEKPCLRLKLFPMILNKMRHSCKSTRDNSGLSRRSYPSGVREIGVNASGIHVQTASTHQPSPGEIPWRKR